MCPDPQPCPQCPDQIVVKHVVEALENAGVQIICETHMRGYVTADEGGRLISGVRFWSQSGGDFEISCQAFIYVDQKHVDMQAFKGKVKTVLPVTPICCVLIAFI